MAMCPICEGLGLRVIERKDGMRVAQECVCREAGRNERMVARANIPKRYSECTFKNYDAKFKGAHPSLLSALRQSQNFVQAYPLDTDGKGFLYIGSVGVGKTHLAVATLRALIERGANGLFYDYRDLLKELQNSYERKVDVSEQEILEPVFEADVLVLDEIGASKASDWAGDTISHIVNTRYNDQKTTIITTNHANLPPGVPVPRDSWAPPRQGTLGDRIGERMRSRLQEMCVVVEMVGEDFRDRVKRANFNSPIKLSSDSSPESYALETPVFDRREILVKEEEDRLFRSMYSSEGVSEKPIVGGARMGSKSARYDVSGRD